jgi:hypothetical protein
MVLHGGGQRPKTENDDAWKQMLTRYWNTVDVGVQVSPRAPGDEWNLHWTKEAQAFYVQLIRDCIVFKNVNPRRVYLVGYSAGGDGVYQLTPRLAPLLAAVNTSAGLPNDISPVNLMHTPMLLQVGELDTDFQRHKETVRYALLIDALETKNPGLYVHDVHVHWSKEHGSVADDIGPDTATDVIANPRRWFTSEAAKYITVARNTGAVGWMRQFTRNTYPEHIVWNASALSAVPVRWYWISLDFTAAPYDTSKEGAEVRCVKGSNVIEIVYFTRPLTVHFHETLIDPLKSVTISVGEQTFNVPPRPSLASMIKSTCETYDHNMCTWQSVTVFKNVSGKFYVL